MTAGFQWVPMCTTQTAFPFDFWSIGANCIHSTNKTGLIGFKVNKSKRWDAFKSYILKVGDLSAV